MSCQGKIKKGEQCKVKAKDGKEVCWRHDPEYIYIYTKEEM